MSHAAPHNITPLTGWGLGLARKSRLHGAHSTPVWRALSKILLHRVSVQGIRRLAPATASAVRGGQWWRRRQCQLLFPRLWGAFSASIHTGSLRARYPPQDHAHRVRTMSGRAPAAQSLPQATIEGAQAAGQGSNTLHGAHKARAQRPCRLFTFSAAAPPCPRPLLLLPVCRRLPSVACQTLTA